MTTLRWWRTSQVRYWLFVCGVAFLVNGVLFAVVAIGLWLRGG